MSDKFDQERTLEALFTELDRTIEDLDKTIEETRKCLGELILLRSQLLGVKYAPLNPQTIMRIM